MLILLPALLLLVMAAIVMGLQRVRPNFGSAWLVSLLATVAALGLMIFFHWFPPAEISIGGWLPISTEPGQIEFRLDAVSWAYGISLLALLQAIVFTAPVRLQQRSNPVTWAGNLAIAGAALLGVLAASPLALILAWTVLDLIDLVVTLASTMEVRVSRSAVIAFVFRLGGTILVFWAMGVSRANGSALHLEAAEPQAAFILLLAVGLRMGVLPLNLPYLSEALKRRGIGSMLRLAGPAASLGVLARLPDTVAPLSISPYLLALSSLAVLYGAAMWMVSRDEVVGRQYWVLALAGVAVGSAIRGQPQASLAWGVALIISGGLLFLYSTRPRVTLFLPILGLIGLAGLPFTPAASGWVGMVVLPFTLPDFLFLVSHSVLLLGYIRHFLRVGDPPPEVERWTQVSYGIGLLLLAAAGWLIGVLGWEGSFTPGVWWASMIPALIALTAGLLYLVLKKRNVDLSQIQSGWLFRVGGRIGGIVSSIFRLNWLYWILWKAFAILQRLFSLITEMLEGAGGVLWVLVLMTLLITIVQANLK